MEHGLFMLKKYEFKWIKSSKQFRTKYFSELKSLYKDVNNETEKDPSNGGSGTDEVSGMVREK